MTENEQQRALEELRQFLRPKTSRVGSGHDGRRYIVTDGVLYEDNFPHAYAALTGEELKRWMRCPECDNVQEDMGCNVACEACGHGELEESV